MSLARALDSLAIYVYCVSETRIQDVPQITAPNLSTKYFLHTSSNEQRKAAGLYGVGIVLSERSVAALLYWIPANSRLCAVRLEGTIHKNRQRRIKRCLFVISAYAPTNSSSDNLKDMFYDQSTAFINQSTSSDIVILVGDLNVQAGKFSPSEYCLGFASHFPRRKRVMEGVSFISVQPTVCSYPVLIFNAIQDAPLPGIFLVHLCDWGQIEHIVVRLWWRSCVHNFKSCWNSYVDSDHALHLCRFK